jgi:hypothetical protein
MASLKQGPRPADWSPQMTNTAPKMTIRQARGVWHLVAADGRVVAVAGDRDDIQALYIWKLRNAAR